MVVVGAKRRRSEVVGEEVEARERQDGQYRAGAAIVSELLLELGRVFGDVELWRSRWTVWRAEASGVLNA